MSKYSIDVHLYMEKGMYDRVVQRAHEQGMPLSAVVRDAVVKYFEDIPEVPEQGRYTVRPEDPIWQLPMLSDAYGELSVPAMPAASTRNEGQE